MPIRILLAFLIFVAPIMVFPKNSQAAIIKYNLSGKYFLVGFPADPGAPITGSFDWDTTAGLLQWNVTLIGFTSLTLTNIDGGTGFVTPAAFQFVDSQSYFPTLNSSAIERFTMDGSFGDPLPIVVGQGNTFSGTYMYRVITESVPPYGSNFTVSGTVVATSSADSPTSPAPEPASMTLIGFSLIGWVGFHKFRKGQQSSW